jgi:hypothetical protein
MKILNPGISYELGGDNHLNFLKRSLGKVVRQGTTNEEVMEVILDRQTNGYESLPCSETVSSLHYLRKALASSLLRTARRIDAEVEGTNQSHPNMSQTADPPLTSAAPSAVVKSSVG